MSDYSSSPGSEPKAPSETVAEHQPLTAMEEKAILRRIDLWYVHGTLQPRS